MGRKAVGYLFYQLSIVATLLLLAAAALSLRASFVSPEQGGLWSTLAMLMPVILLLNLSALVWWLFRRKWILSLFPVAALAINLGYISAMLQLPDLHGQTREDDLRVATFNVNNLRYGNSEEQTAHAIAALMRQEKVGILCMQEFPGGSYGDSALKQFDDILPYAVHDGGQAILSRYPILDHKYVRFADTNNDYLYADLLAEGDTVRVISVHLQTSGIAALHRHYIKEHGQEMPVETMFGTLKENGLRRARQVREIRTLVDSSPMPVILAGDFNDAPSSYTYRQMKGDMTDGFKANGSGFGATFRPIGGVLRIDYIFYDKAFEGVRYYIPREKLSDHRLVIAHVRLKD